MSTTNGHNTGTAPPPSLEELREQTRRARATSRLHQARAEGALWESLGRLYPPAEYFDPYRWGRFDFMPQHLPAGTGGVYSRQDGRNRPWTLTDAQLDAQRSEARWLATTNDLAIGYLKTIRNYTIKKGYEWEARPAEGREDDARALELTAAVQRLIDDHADTNNLRARERSACWRACRDGEFFTRHFPQDDGTTLVRFVECEQVRDPDGADPAYSFGVETDPQDVEHVIAYWVTYDGTDYDRVPAEEMTHHKRNVDECVKRGVSDFFSCGDGFDGASKLLRNMRASAAVIATIAWIEEYQTATASQISAHTAALKSLNVPEVEHPVSGRQVQYEHREPGEIVRTKKDKKFVPPPLAANTENFIAIVQAVLRGTGCRANMPEYMVSGDASNANYSSTLVSGSPFVNGVECEQDDFGVPFRRWRWIAVRNACECGRIEAPFEEVQRLVDIHFTPPQVAVANEAEQAQVDHADMAKGVLSRQTRAARRGLDWEQERKFLEEETPEPQPGAMPGQPGQQQPEEGGDGGPGVLDAIGRRIGKRAHPHRLGESFDDTKHPRGQPGNPGQFGPGGGGAATKEKPGGGKKAPDTVSPGGGKAAQPGRLRRAAAVAKGVYDAVHHTLGAPGNATRALLDEIVQATAAKQGASEAEVADAGKRMRTIVGVADAAFSWLVNVPLAHGLLHSAHLGLAAEVALSKLAFYVPVASLAFVAGSTAADPMGTIRAARKLIKGGGMSKHESKGEAAAGRHDARATMALLAQRLLDAGKSGQADWYQALVMAALDEHQGDLAAAIDAADAAYALHPSQPGVTESVLRESRREGETWRGPSGHYFTLKGGHVQPAHAPGGAGEHHPTHHLAALLHDINAHAVTPEATEQSIQAHLDALDLHGKSTGELKELAKMAGVYPARNTKAALIDAIEREPLFWLQQRAAGAH